MSYKMIDISKVDLRKFVQDAYSLSRPQGLGFLHFKTEPLSDDDADEILGRGIGDRYAFSMDYVHGRSIKLHANKMDGKILINPNWYDHSDEQLEELLKRHGLSKETATIEFAES